jgi:cell division protein FtsB
MQAVKFFKNYKQSQRYSGVVVLLILLLLLLQYKIFIGKNNLFAVLMLQHKISSQTKVLEQLKGKNNKLALKIDFLKHNPLAYEEQARYELGMQKANEVYYQVVMPPVR